LPPPKLTVQNLLLAAGGIRPSPLNAHRVRISQGL